MRIYHNIPALNAYNALNSTNQALTKSIKRLSSGLRINSAADDAAGLAISEKMRAQVSGMEVAVRNAQDGISMLQTAEGALESTQSILQRMRELAVQAANDTLSAQDREYIQLEIDELKNEINNIAHTTKFNGKRLLDGSSAGLWSSTDLATKAYIRGSLRQIDQFNQKTAFEGNYKIQITADPGAGQVQKTDIMKIKHPNVLSQVETNKDAGVDGVRVDNLPAGNYKVETNDNAEGAEITGIYGVNGGQVTTIVGGTPTVYTNKFTFDLAPIATAGTLYLTNLGNNGGTFTINGVTYTLPANGSAYATIQDLASAIETTATKGGVTQTDFKVTGNGEVLTFTFNDTANDLSAYTGSWTILGTSANWSNAQCSNVPGIPGTPVTTVQPDAGMEFKTNGLTNNASILMEVTSVDETNGTVTVKITANTLGEDGKVGNVVKNNVVLKAEDAATLPSGNDSAIGTAILEDVLGAGALKIFIDDSKLKNYTVGAKIAVNATMKLPQVDDGTGTNTMIDDPNAVNVEITGTQNKNWPEKWGSQGEPVTYQGNAVKFGLDAEKVKNSEVHFRNFYVNSDNGVTYEGDIVLTTNGTQLKAGDTLATFEATYIGQIAKGDTCLRDLDKFWTTEGTFLLTDPQTITITQGNGKSTSITLYATDTLNILREKLNTAISKGLGQENYATTNASNFVTYVDEAKAEGNTFGFETVGGTFIIRSLIAGEAGELSFSGSEDLINALSLNVVQKGKENSFTASIYDAHDNSTIVSNVKVSGNQLIGVIHPNVDIEFDAMAGITATWNETTRNFDLLVDPKGYQTVLHLVDNSTVFQVGANEGEDVAIDIGDMSAASLGVSNVVVTNRTAASRSITILDNAISKVSSQRAKIGAYQNSLEYTVSNLTTTYTNLAEAESRIRDADMAQEMMEFVKLQILNQSGTAMLAQANQLPQSVLSLIGG